MKRLTLTGSLLVVATAFFLFGAGSAFAGEGGPAHQAGTLDETTQASVDRAPRSPTSDCKKADGDAEQRDDAAAKLAKAKTPAQIAALQARARREDGDGSRVRRRLRGRHGERREGGRVARRRERRHRRATRARRSLAGDPPERRPGA